MNITRTIATELNVKDWQVDAVIKLIDEGNTIPFIARYRKEMHGTMDDEQLRNLNERLSYLRNLEEKKATVLSSIEEQGMLTPELKKQIEDAETMVKVDDLYRPYRPKRRTRATLAKERGLEPLAEMIIAQEIKDPLKKVASAFVTSEADKAKAMSTGDKTIIEKIVNNEEEAIAGAADILAEYVSDNADYRAEIRRRTMEEGKLISKVKDKALDKTGVYEMYYDFEEALKNIAGHRILATNRGEEEKVLSITVEAPEESISGYLAKQVIVADNPYTSAVLQEMLSDSYKRLIAPAIERDIRNELTERAEDSAIKVFGKNLEQLLMQPPVTGHVVLGWDPAFRTGCKLAVVDATGKVLDTTVIYPTEPQNKVDESKLIVWKLIDKYGIDLISCGNGTASRESEKIIADIIKEVPHPMSYVIVNEAGASVYSASKLATEEFPNFDVGQRSATSIARRIQDPLAELVKIDPKSIGVGQYQHDMNQKKLGDALSGVVEDCVNKVGVDLNTASAALLEYISGISKPLAKNIVAYREANGKFTSRADLLKVPKLGPKAYEQCAGFLRIRGGKNPLDNTSVHPESYKAADEILKELGMSLKDIKTSVTAMDSTSGNVDEGEIKIKAGTLARKISDKEALASKLGIGLPTLEDILSELEKPGRDPREDMPKPVLRSDVLDMKDLKEGMILKGTVRNVIDFGVFVDIGVHQDGLVHISQICNRFIKHPLEAVSVGDIVEVMVLGVDERKGRISLTMRTDLSLDETKNIAVGGARRESGRPKSGSGSRDNRSRYSDNRKNADSGELNLDLLMKKMGGNHRK